MEERLKNLNLVWAIRCRSGLFEAIFEEEGTELGELPKNKNKNRDRYLLLGLEFEHNYLKCFEHNRVVANDPREGERCRD